MISSKPGTDKGEPGPPFRASSLRGHVPQVHVPGAIPRLARPPGLRREPRLYKRRGRWYDSGAIGPMVNYILLYKIRKIVKKIIKDKIADDELATTPKSCIGCLADDISWEVYYLFKERNGEE
jgi:hypothetical protein